MFLFVRLSVLFRFRVREVSALGRSGGEYASMWAMNAHTNVRKLQRLCLNQKTATATAFLLVLVHTLGFAQEGAIPSPTRPVAETGVYPIASYFEQAIPFLTKKHKDPYYAIPAPQWQDKAATIKANLQAAKSSAEKAGWLLQLAALPGDGYTQLMGIEQALGIPLPIRFRFFGEELRVIATDAKNTRWLGMLVTRVDRYTLEEVTDKFRPLLPADPSEAQRKALLEKWLIYPAVLKSLGLCDSVNQVTLMFDENQRSRYKTVLLSSPHHPDSLFVTHSPRPTWLAPAETNGAGWFANAVPLQNTLYVRIDSLSAESNQIKADVAAWKKLFSDAAHSKVVIDLRNNTSSHPLFVKSLLTATQAVRKRGAALYVLVGRHTLGEAVGAARLLVEQRAATCVGEQVGRKVVFSKPLSMAFTGSPIQLVVPGMVSRKQSGFAITAIPETWAAHLKGRDEAMEWIFLAGKK